MKRIIKSSMSVLAAAILLVSVFCLPASAASAVIIVSNKAVEVGKTITVTGKYSGDEELYGFDGSISFDSSKVRYVSGGTNQGSAVQFTTALEGEKTVSVSATFEVIAEGEAYFKFIGNGSDGKEKFTAQSGATVTISGSSPTSSTVSNNAKLKSLSVEGAVLSPQFSGSQTGYNTTVANTVESVKITAAAANSGAKVEGTGSHALEVGDNKISIIVTAADGVTKMAYSINIKRNTPEEDAAAAEGNPLNVKVSGKNYRVVADISALSVPVGFTVSMTVYNNIEVGILSDESKTYNLCWLSDDTTSKTMLFKYNENGEFERLIYADIGERFYIFEKPESNLEAPTGFYETTVELASGNAKAFGYTNSRMSDFYIVYCWCDGEKGFYRYDKDEGIIQRAPDFSLVQPVDNQDTSVLSWVSGLPTVGKIIIITAILAVVTLVLLVVFIILKVKNRRLASPVPMIGDKDDVYSGIEGFSFGDENE